MLQAHEAETRSDAMIQASLQPFLAGPTFLVRPLDVGDMIAETMKQGKSAFMRALAHYIDGNAPEIKLDLRRAYSHFKKAGSLMKTDADSVDSIGMADVYAHSGNIGLLRNLMKDDQPPLNDVVDDLENAGLLFQKHGWSNVVPPIHCNLAMAYGQMGASDKAHTILTNVIAIEPEFANAYLQKGLLHQADGEADAARDYIYEAILLEPCLYRDSFKQIVDEVERWDKIWDETLKDSDSIEMLNEWVEESKRARRKG